MRCIVLFALLAICSAYPYQTGYSSGYGYGSGFGLGSIYNTGKDYQINPDGSLTIYTSTGGKITVSKDIDQQYVVVTVIDSSVIAKKGYPSWFWTPADFLAEILVKYEGDVSPSTYQQLLQEVYNGVQVGKINFGVYQYLQTLNPILNSIERAQIMQQLYQQQAMYPLGQGVGSVGPVTVPTGVTPQFSNPMWNVAGLGGESLWNNMPYEYMNLQNTMPSLMYNKLGIFGQPEQLFEGQNLGYPLNQMVPLSNFWQQYSNIYPKGLYGGYRQGMQQFYNVPMVPVVA